jgi:hypothetical protein
MNIRGLSDFKKEKNVSKKTSDSYAGGEKRLF